jgi:hypothetical protein
VWSTPIGSRRQPQAVTEESGIISVLAVLGLNPEIEGWSTAMNYTPVLLAVVTITRGLVVYRA